MKLSHMTWNSLLIMAPCNELQFYTLFPFIDVSWVYHHNFKPTVKDNCPTSYRLKSIHSVRHDRRKVSIIKIVIKMSP
jgi:hypothetical protein